MVALLKLLLTLLLASEQVNAFSLGGVHQTRARALARQAAPLAQDASVPSAYIEFIIGVPEPCVPDVKLTRSRDGSTGVATFTFDNPSFLAAASAELGETTGVPCFRRPCHLLCARTVAAARVRRHVPQGRRGHTLDHGGAPPVTCPPDGARSTHAVALTLSCTRAPQVTANFVNGKPRIVKGVVVMKSEGEWDRFMRFMERYGAANGLGFSKA
jgi:photosystem II protein